MTQDPDPVEKGIRFGCGGLLGFFVGFISLADDLSDDGNTLIIFFILLNAVTFGYFAMKLGNRFWYSLKDWL